MRLIDVALSVVFVAVFFYLFAGFKKPIFENIEERQKIEKHYNCDKFIAESFWKECGKEYNPKNFSNWMEEVKLLCPIENLRVERLYENNPYFLKAIWLTNGQICECIGKVKK